MLKKIFLTTTLSLNGALLMSMEQSTVGIEKLAISPSEAHSSAISEITSLDQLAIAIMDSGAKPLVIDTYADWCPPCKAMAPIFEELAQELKEQFTFAKVNGDNVKDFIKNYQIGAYPTFIVLQGDKILGKMAGALSKEKFKKKLQTILEGPQDLSKLSKEELSEKLFEAIQEASLAEVQKLIDIGVDVNATDEKGVTPLFRALVSLAANPEEAAKIILTLLKAGCSETIKVPGQQEITLRTFVQNFIDTYSRLAKAYQTLAQELDEENQTSTQEKSHHTSKKECTDDYCPL